MPLSAEQWTECSIHEVVASWLKAERHTRYAASPPQWLQLIDAPNLQDPAQNGRRYRLLLWLRRWLVGELPIDTRWHRVRSLRDEHLPDLRIIGRCGWDDDCDRNELLRAASRVALPLKGAPDTWGAIVLWGHGRAGPFTIIEGNHRLAAYAGSGATGLGIEVYVGLSPSHCFWHLDDPPVPEATILNFWTSHRTVTLDDLIKPLP